MRVLALIAVSVAVPLISGSTYDRWPSADQVSGTVYDSLFQRPLAGAMVQFVGAGDSVVGRVFSAVTDSTGRYQLANVPGGPYASPPRGRHPTGIGRGS